MNDFALFFSEPLMALSSPRPLAKNFSSCYAQRIYFASLLKEASYGPEIHNYNPNSDLSCLYQALILCPFLPQLFRVGPLRSYLAILGKAIYYLLTKVFPFPSRHFTYLTHILKLFFI